MKKTKGMILVDAYYIPIDKAQKYIEQRELCAQRATEVFSEFCHAVSREWAGSEDGEAITGYNINNELICLIHLDPPSIEEMTKAIDKGKLKEYILQCNGISDHDSFIER
ncbi:hypothetical protein KQI38_06120 [Tissierella carlieri]|uniref:hypothetical protein n=1 Tax=Tissierella carlieri TaxID=689904 RepID=UPI001C10A981|nr:hypothetical protein [Tissierella carlieri]MBU5311598.1 hypothetical protein [Tissierella carlieri]